MPKEIWELIAAKINGEILEEGEEEEFYRWLTEEAGNKGAYDRLVKYYRFLREEQEIDAVQAWQFCVKRVYRRRWKIRLLQYGRYVAVVVLMLGMGWGVRYLGFQEESSLPANRKIHAGESKAILTLASGEQVFLQNEQDVLLNEEGGIIRKQEKVLTYNSIDNCPEEKIVYNTLEVPRGGEYQVVLSDGTRVWLNSESRLKYPVTFGEKDRLVTLEGEAYFEVAENPAKPFVITSRNLNIHALGTAFNVTAYRDEAEVITTLVEGDVFINHSWNKTVYARLVPGVQAIFYTETGQVDLRQVDVRLYTSWKDGYYCFEAETLDNIMHTLGRWYDVHVFFENSQARDVRYSGRVKRYGEITEFLDAIRMTDDVEFRIDDRTIFVRKK